MVENRGKDKKSMLVNRRRIEKNIKICLGESK